MNKKGQGALEYLLIIGGAILIAAIVITLLMSARGPTQAGANQALADAMCARNPASPVTSCTGVDPDGSGGPCIAGDCEVTSGICKGKSTAPRTAGCFT